MELIRDAENPGHMHDLARADVRQGSRRHPAKPRSSPPYPHTLGNGERLQTYRQLRKQAGRLAWQQERAIRWRGSVQPMEWRSEMEIRNAVEKQCKVCAPGFYIEICIHHRLPIISKGSIRLALMSPFADSMTYEPESSQENRAIV